jgi:hypothetical protein
MPPSSINNRSMNERVVDVLLWLISQSSSPTESNWYDAVDDLFGDLTEAQKWRVVEAGISMLESRLNPAPVPLLDAA